MKKNWLRKFSAAICAATLFTSGFAMTANAEGETIDPFDWKDYKNLVSPDLQIEGDKDLHGEVEITKKIADPAQTSFNGATTEVPVNGVQFTMTKVGDYAVVEDGNGNPSVMIGIHEDVLEAIGYPVPERPIKDTKGYVYLTSDVYNSLNKDYLFVDDSDKQKFNISEFDTAIEKYQTDKKVKPINEKTGVDETESEDGVAKFHSVPFGIYVVRETNVYNAVADVNEDGTKENVYFSKKQHPYLISVPASVESNNTKTWTDNINVNAKNDTEPVDLDKLIVRGSNSLTGNDGTNDTDVTHIGDTVEFQLKTEVPALDPTQPGDVIDTYIINDVISKGLMLYDLNNTTQSNIIIKDSARNSYALNVDYTVKVDGTVYDGDSENSISDDDYTTGGYAGGKSFTITFTPTGLEKLTALAKNGKFDNYILVNYVAKVNSNAVVGQVGNPNKVQLVYSAAGSHDIETGWEEVVEFIFEMEGTKYFDGKAIDPTALNGEANPNDSVVFELYQSTNGGEKTLVKFMEVKDPDGNVTGYLYNPEGTVTSIKPSANGKFHITGLPVFNESSDTFYLRETATAAGYNKITKDIEIKLVAANKTETGETDEYTGLLSTTSCTVNGKTPGYNDTDTPTGITFTVNNTKGFQLPSTGGMGIWMFVIGGMAVIGCGLLYYRKNAKSAK